MNDQTAILLIDLQRDFLEASGRMPVAPADADNVVSVANRLLMHAVKNGWECIFIKNEFSPEDWFGNLLRRGAALLGSAGAEIDPRVQQPRGARVFAKSRADAFTNPELRAYLQDRAVGRLIVVGVMAEACVRATVKSALRHGYQVIVIPEGVPSDRPWKKRVGLWDMRRRGAQFMTAEGLCRG